MCVFVSFFCHSEFVPTGEYVSLILLKGGDVAAGSHALLCSILSDEVTVSHTHVISFSHDVCFLSSIQTLLYSFLFSPQAEAAGNDLRTVALSEVMKRVVKRLRNDDTGLPSSEELIATLKLEPKPEDPSSVEAAILDPAFAASSSSSSSSAGDLSLFFLC